MRQSSGDFSAHRGGDCLVGDVRARHSFENCNSCHGASSVFHGMSLLLNVDSSTRRALWTSPRWLEFHTSSAVCDARCHEVTTLLSPHTPFIFRRKISQLSTHKDRTLRYGTGRCLPRLGFQIALAKSMQFTNKAFIL